jgi:LysM repeat protein
MAVAPAFMASPLAHAGLAQTSPHTITTSPHTITTTPRTVAARLDAIVKTTAPATRSYTVQAGDTLYGIAQRYWGNGNYWPSLYQANRSKISNPNLIYVGQVVAIPNGRHEASTTPAPSTPASSTPASSTSDSSTWSSSSSHSSASNSSASSTSAPSTADAATSTGSTGATSSSSSGGSSAVTSDIANGNYLLAIGQYLVDNGYSKAAAAGVASCVDGESGGNPESEGDGGGGLIGWTPLGSAAPNSNIITGNASQDMLTQLADILYYNSNEIGQSQVAGLNSQTDPVSAADYFSQNFEKPAVTDSDVVPSVAEQIYSELGG